MDYINPLIGGILIGLGSILAMAASGKIPGISGILAKLILPKPGDVGWRALFITGLIGGAALTLFLNIGWNEFSIPGGRGLTAIAIAGFVVGFGARMGGGCTSGHGVCGMGSGAKDAFIYTVVFMLTAIVTVLVWNTVTKGGAV